MIPWKDVEIEALGRRFLIVFIGVLYLRLSTVHVDELVVLLGFSDEHYEV